jgi:predicted nucleic acid-binding protein
MFLDTSGLLCLQYKTEPFHTQAVTAYKKATTRLTHNYIIAEYVALATARKMPRPSVLTFIADLWDNPDIELIWIDESLHQDAVKLLKARLDKTYSLCDSVSFVIMRQRSITEALTTDKHFEQEGFIRLL